MNRRAGIITALLAAILLCTTGAMSYGQSGGRRSSRNAPPPVQQQEVKRYQVVGGVLREVGATVAADSVVRDTVAVRMLSDSLLTRAYEIKLAAQDKIAQADSLAATEPGKTAYTDSLRAEGASMIHESDSLAVESERLLSLIPRVLHDSLGTEIPARDSLIAAVDSLPAVPDKELSKREQRRLERAALNADSTYTRYSMFFRDTLPISRMTALSFVAPGLGQIHNKQYWKLPILYGTVGAATYLGLQNNHYYRQVKKTYDGLVFYGYDRKDSQLDRVQTVMIKYNQRRQLWFGLAAATYIYFIGDGVMNYPGGSTNVKIATTLSTICPGAGQIYNKSYWKAPIVAGAFATMVMMIDWNNRGYQRFKLAYDQMTSGQTVEPALQRQSASDLQNWRNMYRRNRDLCIILTGAVYLINLVDAHVDAHMKNYDVSDDINLTLNPSLTQISTQRTGSTNLMGLSLNLKF